MQRDLERCLANNQLVEIIYMDRRGQTSKRVLRLYAIEGDKVKAYCFTRRANRVFTLTNILAVLPVRMNDAV
ncbi:MAG: WYL domain-containing protein [Brevibacillus sp.]|nr:WYL domain-containing protein [Brevibacillus sp.]